MAFACLGPLAAQEYIAKVEHYSVEQGLSHRQVNAIFQDSKGFVWIGTPNGLNRFDGYTFRQYTKEKDGLRFNYIQEIAEDADGWLWLVEQAQKNICLFHPDRGEVLSLEEKFGKTDSLFARQRFAYLMLRDDEGAIWLAAMQGNILYRYHPASGVRAIPVEGSPGKIYPIRFSERKTLWVSTENDNILELSLTGKILHRIEDAWLYGEWALTDDCMLSITRKPAGAEHLVTFDLEGNVLPFLPVTGSPAPHPALIFPFDNKGAFIIHDRLVDAQGHTLAQWEFTQHDRNNYLWRGYMIDRAGRFWLGDDFGFYILQIKKNRFHHFFYQKGAKPGLGNSVRGIVATPDKVYANLERFGLYEQNIRGGQIRRIEASGTGWGNYALAFSKNGEILSGNQKALYRLTPDASNGKIIPASFDVWAICEDYTGTFWLGSSTDGLHTLPSGATAVTPFTRHNGFDALASAFVLHIAQDQSGLLWVCASNGFYKVNPRNGVLARYWPGGTGEYFLPAENFLHFHLDAGGIFWFATSTGLLRADSRTEADGSRSPVWNERTGKWFNRTNSLSNDFIYAVYEDKSGRLWMPTDHGIICMNKKSEAVKTYFVSDGLTDAEFNRKAHFQAPGGTLYFGGLNGINAFDPADFKEINDTLTNIPLALTAYQQFDGKSNRLVDRTFELLRSRTITLRPDDRFFNLELALLSFEEPQLIQYAWKLDGLDKDWHYQKERQINFGGLPYGDYTLRIKAQAADGQWSGNELVLTIKSLPPWHLQTWFLITTALLLGGAVLGYNRWRIRQHILEQKRLEDEVKKATERIELDKQTIEKQAEELRHLDKIKSNFFANVSHELRTPLSLLLGPIGTVLKRNKLENQDFTLIKLAQVHTRQLLQLVNQILDLSKLESGKLELHESPVLLYPLVRRIVAAFESHADQRGIRFVFQFQPEKNLRLLLDAGKMETILNNLLSNALKFTPPNAGGEVGLTVESRAHCLRLMVSDTGRGIHPDDLPHVFNRFYQSAQPNAPIEGGTGIGLALCKELAELMQGSIWAESTEPGAGSRFFLEIPLKEVLGVTGTPDPEPVDATELPSDITAAVPVNAGEKEYTVMVVEDNKSLRDYIRSVLSEKYHVVTAENGQAALEALSQSIVNRKSEIVNLVISDIMMPVMDGFQLLENLKSHAQYRLIPVIMLTARAEVQDQLHALRIGVDDYLLKPFEEEELLARVAALLECYRERERWRTDMAAATAGTADPEAAEKASEAPGAAELAWLEVLETLMRREVQNDLVSVAWLAEHLFLSERQLQRRINRLTGLAPNAYIREVRLQEARRMMEQRQVQTLKEAAWAVGLRDEKYFSQIFRERFGKSPADWLR